MTTTDWECAFAANFAELYETCRHCKKLMDDFSWCQDSRSFRGPSDIAENLELLVAATQAHTVVRQKHDKLMATALQRTGRMFSGGRTFGSRVTYAEDHKEHLQARIVKRLYSRKISNASSGGLAEGSAHDNPEQVPSPDDGPAPLALQDAQGPHQPGCEAIVPAEPPGGPAVNACRRGGIKRGAKKPRLGKVLEVAEYAKSLPQGAATERLCKVKFPETIAPNVSFRVSRWISKAEELRLSEMPSWMLQCVEAPQQWKRKIMMEGRREKGRSDAFCLPVELQKQLDVMVASRSLGILLIHTSPIRAVDRVSLTYTRYGEACKCYVLSFHARFTAVAVHRQRTTRETVEKRQSFLDILRFRLEASEIR